MHVSSIPLLVCCAGERAAFAPALYVYECMYVCVDIKQKFLILVKCTSLHFCIHTYIHTYIRAFKKCEGGHRMSACMYVCMCSYQIFWSLCDALQERRTSYVCISYVCTLYVCTSSVCTSYVCTSSVCTSYVCTSSVCTSYVCTSSVCTSSVCTSYVCTLNHTPCTAPRLNQTENGRTCIK